MQMASTKRAHLSQRPSMY